MKFRTVTVYDSEQTKEEIPANLTEYIAWLQIKLKQIPEEHRVTARAAIFASESCGMPVLCYTIKYDIPTA